MIKVALCIGVRTCSQTAAAINPNAKPARPVTSAAAKVAVRYTASFATVISISLRGLFFRRPHMAKRKQQRHVVDHLEHAADHKRQPGKRSGQESAGKRGADTGSEAARHGGDARRR